MLTDQDEMNNLYREHYIDASYQASVHWAMGFQSRRLKYEKLQTDDGSNDGNSSRCLWQALLKSFDEYQGDNTNSNITSFFRFVNKRAIYRWYTVISFTHAPVNVSDFSIGSINGV